MGQTVEQVVREYHKASKMVLSKIKTPEKARAFLLKAGIIEKHSKSRNGVRLAKPFR
jgi:hypothetical protein